MRNCDNCDYGHYNNDNLICAYNEYIEEYTNPNSVCNHHEYIDGFQEEKTYLLYDETYLAPGYIFATKENGELTRFFKLYTVNSEGFPCFAIRAFDRYAIDKSDMTFNELKFTFRSKEDDESGLFDLFYKLALSLRDEEIHTIDYDRNGKNKIKFEIDENIVTMRVYKDVYGIKNPSDFVEILLGDEITCEHYAEILSFYTSLPRCISRKAKDEDIKELRMAKVILERNR